MTLRRRRVEVGRKNGVVSFVVTQKDVRIKLEIYGLELQRSFDVMSKSDVLLPSEMSPN